jgi:hypothetical protein
LKTGERAKDRGMGTERLDDRGSNTAREAAKARFEATALRQRERQAFGGEIQWEAAFFGWLAAVGLAAMLVAIVVGAGVAVGLTDLKDSAGDEVQELSFGGGALLVAVIALSYCAGGYVAGRMARFDGWRQGLGVWGLSVLMALALAVAAWIAGGEINPLKSLDLPRIPVDEGPLTEGGAIATGVLVLVALGSAIVGGILGERFHRAVDQAGVELEREPLPVEPEPVEGEEELVDAEPEPDEAEPAETADHRASWPNPKARA